MFTARTVIVSPERVLAGGGFLVVDGRIREVFETRAELERHAGSKRVCDLGEGLLVPGLVNAHAHLELSDLHGKVEAGPNFPTWIRALLGARAASDTRGRDEALQAALATLMASGCTAVGDIDSTGSRERLAKSPLEIVSYRELLDIADASRREEALEGLRSDTECAAISPHAPYTVSGELALALGTRARERGLRVGIHWAETLEEREWLEHGRGPFGELFESSPKRSGLELFDAAGLLSERTALYHANDANAAEVELVANCGASVVHCPGTHKFFGRPEFDAARWRRAGVPLALGTDSLASNETLDMRRELALCEVTAPGLSARERFEAATVGGARALGLEASCGSLEVGRGADFFLLEGPELSAVAGHTAFELVASKASLVSEIWIRGERRGSEEPR